MPSYAVRISVQLKGRLSRDIDSLDIDWLDLQVLVRYLNLEHVSQEALLSIGLWFHQTTMHDLFSLHYMLPQLETSHK